MGDETRAASEVSDDAAPGVRFPRFVRRIRALWVDTAVFAAIYVSWILALDWLYQFPPVVRVASFVLPVLFLEPALVAWTGGTVGHHAVGIQVRDAEQNRRIGFGRACVRAAIKAVLGWASLVFALVGHRHQAIHDMATRSMVVLSRPAALPPSEVLESRSPEVLDYRYPSTWRRVVMILAWWIGSTVAYLSILALIGASDCHPRRGCGPLTFVVIALNLGWTASVLSIPALGWYGHLYGARRVKADDSGDHAT